MNNPDSLKESLLQRDLCKIFMNAGLTGVGDIVFKLLNYLTVWMVVRVIGPAQYGLYLLAWSITTFASVISSLGFPAGSIKFISQFNGQGDKSRVKGAIFFPLQMVLILSCLLVPVLILSAGFLENHIFKKPGFSYALRLISLSLPFITATYIISSSIQGFQVIKYIIYVEKFIQPACFLILAAILLAFGFTLDGLILAKVVSTLIGFLIAMYYLNRIFPLFGKNIQTSYERRQMMAFSSPLILAVFLNFLVLYTDILMLGYFRSSEEVGIYGVIARIVPLILVPLTSFEVIFSPMVADLFHKGETCRLESLHKLITKWICIFSLPIFWLIILLAKPLLYLFGADFPQAQIPMILLAIGQISRVLVGISGCMVLMTNHPRLSLMNNAMLFGLNVILNCLLIPTHGIFGASLATFIAYVLMNNMEMLEIYKIIKIHPYSTQFLKPVVAGFLSFLFVYPVIQSLRNWPGIGVIIMATGFFLAIYIIILRFLGFAPEDKFILNKIKEYVIPIPGVRGDLEAKSL